MLSCDKAVELMVILERGWSWSPLREIVIQLKVMGHLK